EHDLPADRLLAGHQSGRRVADERGLDVGRFDGRVLQRRGDRLLDQVAGRAFGLQAEAGGGRTADPDLAHDYPDPPDDVPAPWAVEPYWPWRRCVKTPAARCPGGAPERALAAHRWPPAAQRRSPAWRRWWAARRRPSGRTARAGRPARAR